MYRIMIADDEGIVIDSLRVIIERSWPEHCVVESAKTGRSVIQLAERFRPDIAFMDIQMPGLNGIDAIEEIQKTNPTTQFIILSAYDKFDYAKKALSLGVMEYMMKPFNAQKINDCLERAMKKVDQERSRRASDLENKEKLKTVLPILENGFLHSILFENFRDNTEEIMKFKELLDIRQEYGYIVMIEYGDTLEDGNLTNPIGASVKAHGFYQELREITQEFFDCLTGQAVANRVILLVPCDQPEAEYGERIQIIERGRNMLNKLRRRIDAQFRIGIGTIKPMEEFPASYNEAQRAMKSTRRSVAHIKDIATINEADRDGYPEDNEKRMIALVRNGNFQGASQMAAGVTDYLFQVYSDHPDAIKNRLLELVFEAWHQLPDEKRYGKPFLESPGYYQEVTRLSNSADLQQWFLDKIKMICAEGRTDESGKNNRIINAAKAYIESNFHRDISLEEVSRTINISPYYFSRMFKEETGVTFIEYVTEERIKRARQLLEDRRLSIKEVCLESGYSDPNYFSRIFKKAEGVTPTEYREKLWG